MNSRQHNLNNPLNNSLAATDTEKGGEDTGSDISVVTAKAGSIHFSRILDTLKNKSLKELEELETCNKKNWEEINKNGDFPAFKGSEQKHLRGSAEGLVSSHIVHKDLPAGGFWLNDKEYVKQVKEVEKCGKDVAQRNGLFGAWYSNKHPLPEQPGESAPKLTSFFVVGVRDGPTLPDTGYVIKTINAQTNGAQVQEFKTKLNEGNSFSERTNLKDRPHKVYDKSEYDMFKVSNLRPLAPKTPNSGS